MENVSCNCSPRSIRDLIWYQRLSLVASLMFLTSTALRYHLVNCTIDTGPKHWTSRSCSPFICSKMTFMNAVKNFWSQTMRNYYSITLEHQSLIATYFISVVPVWPGFCGCFILDLRPPIHDNRLQLLKFLVLLCLIFQFLEYGFRNVSRVQDINFKLIRLIWCFDRKVDCG